MIFHQTKLAGAYIIELEKIADSRGFFAESFSSRQFEQQGLNCRIAQCNVSFNHKKGTLRGMHFQIAPATEVKIVRCTRGAVFDAIVDIRPCSATYGQWIGVELSADNHKALYVPEMFAHGYQTLADNSEVTYQVSEFYTPSAARGYRYDDPGFGIQWPLPVVELSGRDAAWEPFGGNSGK
ncbi:MAG: dTDP-4-dehydrorhamnose 3,5-epimerase [Phycisphaerales bacterium]|jgi:dTDP-4-dehydrorhamnose 3,5-epimerase|nr:dTDP-4-dehydrorhamnose 3,5-epimerase [Phycisphaerales bacterium]